MERPISTTWPLPPLWSESDGDGEEDESPEGCGGFGDEEAFSVGDGGLVG